MADIVLKVSPDTLKEKASNIQNNIKKIETAWIKIENTMHKTRNYWQANYSRNIEYKWMMTGHISLNG